jgi:alpha-glucosidase
LLNEPRYAPILPLLQTLPVTWDETIVLPGSAIGQLAAFARRKGNNWYVAVINGADSAVAFRFLPSFLQKGKTYQATVVTDQPNDTGFSVRPATIQPSLQQSFTIPPTGGIVIAVKRK